LLESVVASAQQNAVVAVPARAGAVEGTAENSDAFIWRVFTELTTHELKKNVESRRDWFDSTIGNDPDTWEETERRWLASKGMLRRFPRYQRQDRERFFETARIGLSYLALPLSFLAFRLLPYGLWRSLSLSTNMLQPGIFPQQAVWHWRLKKGSHPLTVVSLRK